MVAEIQYVVIKHFMSFVDVCVTRLLMLPSNGQLVCLRPVGILNPVKFNLKYLVFQAFTWPH